MVSKVEWDCRESKRPSMQASSEDNCSDRFMVQNSQFKSKIEMFPTPLRQEATTICFNSSSNAYETRDGRLIPFAKVSVWKNISKRALRMVSQAVDAVVKA